MQTIIYLFHRVPRAVKFLNIFHCLTWLRVYHSLRVISLHSPFVAIVRPAEEHNGRGDETSRRTSGHYTTRENSFANLLPPIYQAAGGRFIRISYSRLSFYRAGQVLLGRAWVFTEFSVARARVQSLPSTAE